MMDIIIMLHRSYTRSIPITRAKRFNLRALCVVRITLNAVLTYYASNQFGGLDTTAKLFGDLCFHGNIAIIWRMKYISKQIPHLQPKIQQQHTKDILATRTLTSLPNHNKPAVRDVVTFVRPSPMPSIRSRRTQRYPLSQMAGRSYFYIAVAVCILVWLSI